MIYSRFGVLVAAASVLLCSGPHSAQAAVIISLDNVSVLPGATAEVAVYAASDSADAISGFNLPIDFNRDGNNSVLPNGFALDVTPLRNALFTNLAFNTTTAVIPIIGVDGIVNSSNDVDVDLTATPLRLFSVTINVSPDAVIGSVLPLEIEVPADPFSALFNVAGPRQPNVLSPTIGTPVYGSVTVTPEPSSAVLLCAATWALRRRSFRRRCSRV